jgi:hypothetical protein
MKKTLKLKINPIREYLGLIIYPIKGLAGLFFLIKSRETIPLKNALCISFTLINSCVKNIYGNATSRSESQNMPFYIDSPPLYF